jgi:hypothetical protein
MQTTHTLNSAPVKVGEDDLVHTKLLLSPQEAVGFKNHVSSSTKAAFCSLAGRTVPEPHLVGTSAVSTGLGRDQSLGGGRLGNTAVHLDHAWTTPAGDGSGCLPGKSRLVGL